MKKIIFIIALPISCNISTSFRPGFRGLSHQEMQLVNLSVDLRDRLISLELDEKEIENFERGLTFQFIPDIIIRGYKNYTQIPEDVKAVSRYLIGYFPEQRK